MNEKLVHRTKTSLREEAKAFLPTVKEFYPHLDDMFYDFEFVEIKEQIDENN